jgi:hypothetical protein
MPTSRWTANIQELELELQPETNLWKSKDTLNNRSKKRERHYLVLPYA